jgi:hypothetical protein
MGTGLVAGRAGAYLYDSGGREKFGSGSGMCRPGQRRWFTTATALRHWVMFVILLLGCFPLCVLGLLIRENVRVGSDCRIWLDR